VNILYLCDEYPPGQHGGIGTSVRLLAREMVKQGHQVVVAGLYSPGYGGENEFDDEGVKVYRFRWGLDGKLFKYPQSLLARIAGRLLKDSGIMEKNIKRSLSRYKEKLERIIADHHIDIIEMPDYNDYIRFCKGYVPFPVLSKPVVIKMNGSITYFICEENKQPAPNIFKMEQAILTQAVAVAAVSRYTATKSAEYFDYSRPIEILPNGIKTDVPLSDVSRNSKQVVFTGSLMQKKGIYQLAQAWNIVNRSRPDAQLIILGRGSQQNVISYLTNEAKNTVKFTGHVSTEELYEFLAGSAISIFPSYAEAFALAPLEAMVCGTAVINSNRTSGPELIDDNVNGLLIDPDDIDQIAASILYLLNDADACALLARNGAEKVRECFEISEIAEQNLVFYERVLGEIG
jgi:glycogen(starch) synthase